jgi:hypothetical protein
MSELILQNAATPATPAAGFSTLYADSADRRVKAILDDAAIHVLSPSRLGVNGLMNGGFWFAQRQAPGTLTTYSNTSGRTYGADRWGMTNENASIQYQRIDTAFPETGLQARFYGRFKKITSAGKMVVSQVVEGTDIMPFRGRTVRFQAKMRFSVAASMTVRLGLLYLTSAGTIDTIPAAFVSAFGAAGTDPTWGTNLTAIAPTQVDGGSISGLGMTCVLTSGWVRYSACFAVPSNCLNLIAAIWTNGLPAANDELNIGEAGLYDGFEILDWSPLLVQRELERCQRYYSKTFAIDTAPAQSVGVNTGEFKFIAGRAGALLENSPSYMRAPVMRIAPTNTAYNPAAANAQVRDETGAVDCSAQAFAGNIDRSVGITATGNAATAVGNLLGVHVSSDAEL